MIKAANISKTYVKNRVIDDVTLEFKPGKLITLLGVNGSGKSTLLRLVSGNELPDGGVVSLNDENLRHINFKQCHQIGFVDENLDYGGRIPFNTLVDALKMDIPAWDQDFFNQMVEDRKIDISRPFVTYSRGQKMQLALILNLSMRPKVLFLDEITSVMDTYARKYFLEVLKKYVSVGNTVIITTNIVNELEFYTDELLILKEGKVALNVQIDEISKKFTKIRQVQGDINPIFEDENCLWAGTNSDHSTSYIIDNETLKNYNADNILIDKRSSTMEDIFIYYFSEKEDRI